MIDERSRLLTEIRAVIKEFFLIRALQPLVFIFGVGQEYDLKNYLNPVVDERFQVVRVLNKRTSGGHKTKMGTELVVYHDWVNLELPFNADFAFIPQSWVMKNLATLFQRLEKTVTKESVLFVEALTSDIDRVTKLCKSIYTTIQKVPMRKHHVLLVAYT